MILFILTGFFNCCTLSGMEPASRQQNEKKALTELISIVEHGQRFIKAHAAEYLIWTGHPEPALKEFLKEEKLYAHEPKYRVVIWRVLAQAESRPVRKKIWLNKIYDAYKDMDGPDRTHATETLAKLKQPVTSMFPCVTAKTLASADRNLQAYALWASSLGSASLVDTNREKFLDMALADTSLGIRKISAFVLRQIKGLNSQQWERLSSAALSTVPTNENYVTLLATSLVTAPAGADNKTLLQINDLLIKNVNLYNNGQQIELSLALAEKGRKKNLKTLLSFFKQHHIPGLPGPGAGETDDLRAAAAYAILKIYSREKIH